MVWNSVALEHAGLAHQRLVRRQHDVAARDGVAVRRDRSRFVAERVGRGVLEDHPAAVADRARQAGEILARMKPRLVLEADSGPRRKRHVVDERRIEAELGRQGASSRSVAITFASGGCVIGACR